MTAEQEPLVARLTGEGVGVSAIARATGLSRPTIYRILGEDGSARPGRGKKVVAKVGGGGGEGGSAEPPVMGPK